MTSVLVLERGVACGPVVDDDDLLRRLRAGDEAAFAALVREYQPRLLRLAESIGASRAVAEEIVQDVWIAVLRGIDRFEGRSSFKTWLFRILVNRARTTAGREHRTVSVADLGADEAFDGTGAWASPPVHWSDQVDDRLVASDLAARVVDVLPSLPEAQRQVVVLRDVEGLPAADVADLLGITDGNQRVLLHRARGRIRAALEGEVTAR